ncbi:MAG: hypothetical protein IH945_02080 [Armatimonadetes bacterium]|nr:hypothetical protein [Armatimonadota bacterium]
MAYPFGGLPADILETALTDSFGIEVRLAVEMVDTPDGPQHQPYWFNPANDRFVEAPGGPGSRKVSVERAYQIADRLGVDYPDLLGRCMTLENERDQTA